MRTLAKILTLAALLGAESAHAATVCAEPEPTPIVYDDLMSASRVARRLSLTLAGTTPSEETYATLAALEDPGARRAAIAAYVDELLESPRFYEQMLRFGREWIGVGAYTTGAQGDAYQGDIAGHLFPCPASSPHAGALYAVNEYESGADKVCFDLDASNNPITPIVNEHEPWWAPGTTVSVVGLAGTEIAAVPGPGDTLVDCGVAGGGYYDPGLPSGCGCGPNLVWCSPLRGLGGGSNHDLFNAQRRHPYEEPARLFAHLAWHERSLADLVTGDYSVGTNWLRALYVRLGRQAGIKAADANTTWWQPAADSAPRDPLHPEPGDPQAWREFVVEDLHPLLIADREYTYDPRTTTQPPDGLPAAGVLTMPGSLSSFPRERVRAARFLEAFACMSFSPPSADQQFPAYVNDPAKGGTCMHCHQTLDPAAIFFKRWDFGVDSYYVPWPFMPGLGRYRIGAAWLSGQYPHGPEGNSPGFRWKNAFTADTVMTPVTPAQIAANPEAVFLDTMPQSYSLLGEHGDGTMGPLGFGKILVASGEMDRCAVRRLYARIVGRALDPAAERLYIERLAQVFVDNGRRVRPFIRHLVQQPEMWRGL